MTKKKVKAEQRYMVLRTFGRDGKWKHQAGTVITDADIPGEPIGRLIARKVIKVC